MNGHFLNATLQIVKRNKVWWNPYALIMVQLMFKSTHALGFLCNPWVLQTIMLWLMISPNTLIWMLKLVPFGAFMQQETNRRWWWCSNNTKRFQKGWLAIKVPKSSLSQGLSWSSRQFPYLKNSIRYAREHQPTTMVSIIIRSPSFRD
jgi:hypothetical protein